jgi:hypothetical protein
LQYSGGHVGFWHWVSTQPSSNLVGKLIDNIGRPSGTLISSIACGFLNVQVRVYDQPEGPAVPQPRRAPMLFARADEIIE